MLETKGHQVLVTSRKYAEAERILALKRIRARIIGKHGGRSLARKLTSGAERIVGLSQLISSWRPRVSVSFSSPEAARVAFGLGIPHVTVNDSPHSRFVARLTIPISERVCSPWIVPKHVWIGLGAKRNGIVHYRALDPVAWLRRFKPDERTLRHLPRDGKPLVVFRTEEAFASYLLGVASDARPVVLPIIERLIDSGTDAHFIAIPRYGRQAETLKRRLGDKVRVLTQPVDGATLLSKTSVFVGSGGTMTMEAALLGVPSFSCYPGEPPLYEDFLVRKRLVVREKRPGAIVNGVRRVLKFHDEYIDDQRSRARRLFDWMEDPIPGVCRVLLEVGRGSSRSVE